MFLLCFKIFLARICDVSLGTVRTMMIVKGKRIISSIIAFVEVMIWFYAAREAINTNIESILIPISYALGYSTGTFIGNSFNKHIINTLYEIQVITNKNIYYEIRKNNYGITKIELDDKYLLLIEVNKDKYRECIKLIKKLDSKSFITVKETMLVYNGYAL